MFSFLVLVVCATEGMSGGLLRRWIVADVDAVSRESCRVCVVLCVFFWRFVDVFCACCVLCDIRYTAVEKQNFGLRSFPTRRLRVVCAGCGQK